MGSLIDLLQEKIQQVMQVEESQKRKQAEHDKLLEELAEMVDKRRMELLQREREVQL